MRDDDDIDDTVVRRPVSARPGPDDDVFGDTVIRPPAVPRADDSASDVSASGDTASDDTVVRSPARPGAERDARGRGEPHLQADPLGSTAPPMPSAPVRRVPSIRIGDRVLRLDRPVIIGRRPSLPRVLRGPVPELVTVPSASGQVSSSHVLVHAEGEAAVVDDLRSTNGTVVRPAGAAPFRMPAGASNVVLTGTVVEIGDGNVIEVLSPHLRVAPSAGDLSGPPALPSDPPAGPPRTPRERS